MIARWCKQHFTNLSKKCFEMRNENIKYSTNYFLVNGNSTGQVLLYSLTYNNIHYLHAIDLLTTKSFEVK